MAIDPVCNMAVDERAPAATATVAGRTYYFCALSCRQAFLELGLGDAADAQPPQLVDRQGNPVASQSIPSGVVAILFTDVQASTELMEELGQELGHATMRAELDRQQEAVERQGGYAVKRLGDGMMAAFGAPEPALRCAVAVQSDDARDAKVRIRVGLHTGEVVVDGGDYFGKTVIMAARITARAQGGEILLSEGSRATLEPPDGWRFGRTRRARLKGFSGWQRFVSVARVN